MHIERDPVLFTKNLLNEIQNIRAVLAVREGVAHETLLETGRNIADIASMIDLFMRSLAAHRWPDDPGVPVLNALNSIRFIWIRKAAASQDPEVLKYVNAFRQDLDILKSDDAARLKSISDLFKRAKLDQAGIALLNKEQIEALEIGYGDGRSDRSIRHGLAAEAFEGLYQRYERDIQIFCVDWRSFTDEFMEYIAAFRMYPVTASSQYSRRSVQPGRCPPILLERVRAHLHKVHAKPLNCFDSIYRMYLRESNFRLTRADSKA